MLRFESFEELLKVVGVEFSQEKKYCNDLLREYLECSGSDNVENEEDEPDCILKIELTDKVFEVGVTNIEISEDQYKCYYWLDSIESVVNPIEENLKKELTNKLDTLKIQYDNLYNEIIYIKANGNLSKLCTLRGMFDESFDTFFDDEGLRKKYNDWNYENDCILFEKTNSDLEEELDKKDLKKYIEFYKDCIDILNDKINELKERE